ncbi:hypothetical protein [Dehalogenimonas formicexedens]|nr:hypothetical protein [Dehalogenimonas formicexedens]
MVSIEGLFEITDEIKHQVPKEGLINQAVSSGIPNDLLNLLYSLPQGRYTPRDVAYMAVFPTRFAYGGL